ncbi:unnamed protein product, partial [Didymodactylos carnosus]
MSSSSCRFGNQCTDKNCMSIHPQRQTRGVNPKPDTYIEKYKSPECTFTHTKPKRIDDTNDNDDEGSDDSEQSSRSFLSVRQDEPISRIPCSNGLNCERIGCPFDHCSSTVRMLSRPQDKSVHRVTECRHGSECTRKDCYFNHPSSSVRAVSRTRDGSTTRTTECRRGSACTRERPRNEPVSALKPTTLASALKLPIARPNVTEKVIRAERKQNTHIRPMTTDSWSLRLGTDVDDLLRNHDELIKNCQEKSEDLEQNPLLDEMKAQRDEFCREANKIQAELNSGRNFEQTNARLTREMRRLQAHLPIYARRTSILNEIKKNQVVVLKADTGSGKSTQLIQYIHDSGLAKNGEALIPILEKYEIINILGYIVCTQPRKLACRTLAARVAEEYGCQIGEEVGYQVGNNRKLLTSTMMRFVTDTLFLNEHIRDPLLQQYSIVIVDEAHERKVDTDLVFGIMKQCLRRRKDLKLIVMSATLDMSLLNTYFSPQFTVSLIEVSGRTFPIEDEYLDDDPESYVLTAVAKAFEIHQSNQPGDILVFLTGPEEIDQAINELKPKLMKEFNPARVLPLHGKLTDDNSAKVFEKCPDERKIIFSTNVAETSVTIDGVKHVIDSGMVKEKMWDEKRKMQILKIGYVTKSSVKQRRGRAGRTSSGKCYHLYTLETYESLEECPCAEVLCTQPSMAVLKLKRLGIENVETFEWLESPSKLSIQEAIQSLKWLQALDERTGELTNVGRRIADMAVNPMLATMLLKAEQLGCLNHALILGGMLTVTQNLWWRGIDDKSRQLATEARAKFIHKLSDHLTLVNVYLKWNAVDDVEQLEWCNENYLNAKAM